MLVAAGVSALDVVYVAASLLDGLARLLVFLLVYRVVMRRALRDLRDVAFLAFFMLVAAAPLTFGVGFLFVFLVFLVLGTWMLMLYHVATESERVGERSEDAVGALGRDLLGLAVGASAATLVLTAALFFLIPRVGQAALTLRSHQPRMLTGFSDRVELGAFGDIETDATVVMRVRLLGPGLLAPERLPGLRWRGLALDRYAGGAWTSSRRERAAVRRSPLGRFELAPFRGTGPVVMQEVYLEPFGADVLFAAPRVLAVELRADAVLVDDMAGVSVPNAAARFRYVAESELESGGAGDVRPLDDETRARYLELPPLPPRVRSLALEITASAREPREAARALAAHLASRYRYTLALGRATSLDPVEEFLFVQRAGNCEYFAAALAVMLRSLDVPARVVNGFQRGEWNPYGGYFMVRLLDAHSWVEAYLDGAWVHRQLEPSGSGHDGAQGPRGGARLEAAGAGARRVATSPARDPRPARALGDDGRAALVDAPLARGHGSARPGDARLLRAGARGARAARPRTGGGGDGAGVRRAGRGCRTRRRRLVRRADDRLRAPALRRHAAERGRGATDPAIGHGAPASARRAPPTVQSGLTDPVTCHATTSTSPAGPSSTRS
ncbi:MAG: hypothetical protein DME15_03085 [Candidatus Rokuibacteriota bacterium]|nr:MAG: hypothetical protein DME15_03085 [Candidatus Rokubacteria bacterium]